MDPELITLKAKRAAAILGNPEIMGYISEIQADLLAGMVSTTPEQQETRELLYYQHLGLQNLIAYLNTYVSAAATLEHNKTELE